MEGERFRWVRELLVMHIIKIAHFFLELRRKGFGISFGQNCTSFETSTALTQKIAISPLSRGIKEKMSLIVLLKGSAYWYNKL